MAHDGSQRHALLQCGYVQLYVIHVLMLWDNFVEGARRISEIL